MNAPQATGRWIIVPRITTGTRRITTGLRRWLAGHGLKGAARARGVAGRIVGTLFIAWFLGGMLWALGTPPWAVVPLWLLAALVASYRDVADTTTAKQDQTSVPPEAFVELLHDIAHGGNVHLTRVRDQLADETSRPWTAQEVTELCRAAGIPTRQVRVPGATPAVTTGVHRADIPPLPHAGSGAPAGGVGAGHDDNNNTNNTTVEAIGGGAAVIVKHGPSTRQDARR